MRSIAIKSCITLLSLLCVVLPGRADELAEKGRDVFNKYQHSVVTVEVVIKISYSMEGRTPPPNEQRHDITATVIDPSGLAVTALSGADPSDLMQRAAERSGYKVDAEVTDMKILLEDGTELPAQIVLRDKDLDLAFIRPKTAPPTPMTAVDLTNAGSAQPLDQYITINRLNKAAERAYCTSIERISAVVSKPRTFYIPDSTMTTTALGSPGFTPDGKFLGIDVMRYVGLGEEGSGGSVASILRPAADILKASKQAPEATPDAGSSTTNSPATPSK